LLANPLANLFEWDNYRHKEKRSFRVSKPLSSYVVSINFH